MAISGQSALQGYAPVAGSLVDISANESVASSGSAYLNVTLSNFLLGSVSCPANNNFRYVYPFMFVESTLSENFSGNPEFGYAYGYFLFSLENNPVGKLPFCSPGFYNNGITNYPNGVLQKSQFDLGTFYSLNFNTWEWFSVLNVQNDFNQISVLPFPLGGSPQAILPNMVQLRPIKFRGNFDRIDVFIVESSVELIAMKLAVLEFSLEPDTFSFPYDS